MRKLLCCVLCLSLVCALLPLGTLTQVAQAASEVVLLDTDFEGGTVGANVPTKADTALMWTHRVESATSTIKTAQDAEQGKVACYSNTATKSGGPRLEKVFYFGEDMTNLSISFKLKTVATSLRLAVEYADGTEVTLLSDSSANTWSSYKIDLDYSTLSYVVRKNNTQFKTGTLTNNDRSLFELKFATSVSADKYMYIDDVKITTTDALDLETVSNGTVALRTPAEIMAPFASYPSAPATATPTGMYEMFNYDCSLNANNGVSGGTDALFTGRNGVEPAILNATSTDDGKLIRMTNTRVTTQAAYLSKKLAVGTKMKTVGVEYYAVLSDSKTYVQLRDADDKIVLSLGDYAISENTAGAVADSWNKIKAVFDVEHSLCDLYVNDTPVAEDVAFTAAFPADDSEAFIYIYGSLGRADTILLDNFVMYQDSAPVLDTVKYYGTTGTTWALVANDVALTGDSYVNNLRQHPRVMINDRQALLDKIASDPQTAKWYASVKSAADTALTADVYTYDYGNGRNILDVARNIGTRLWNLSMAYLVEQNDAYVERAILEMRNAATFPDWSNSAPIIPSEIMLGFAGFYDWCYNSPVMTDAVKAEMVQIIKDQALWQFVRSYDGVISVEIAKGNSNRTTVANSAAGLLAIAIADEYPQLAQYLFDNALKYMMPAINVYGSDGAYPEGASYWSYPMRTITPFLSSIVSAAQAGYTLPENAQWYFDNEALKNTNDYWAYVSGATANFDFGDASPGLSATSAIYWHAQRTNDSFIGWYANHILAKTGSSAGNAYFAIPWYDPEFDYYNDGSMPLDKTFDAAKTAQIASMRSSWSADDALYAALQGGYNGTGHMFKSLGTFVLDANGQRFVRTIGRSNYSALYSPYMYYNERAEGQNTIIANPGEAFDQNTTAYASFVKHEEAENEAFTVLDMTETNDAFTDAKRGMYMTPGRRSVVLQDEITTSFPSEIWWFAHTDAEIALSEDGKSAMLYLNGERMFVRITGGPESAVFTVMDARPLPTSPVAPDEAYRGIEKLAIHLTEVSELSLTVEFIPLKAGEAAPTVYTPVKPIADWSVSDHTISTNRQAGSNLVMLTGSPNALALEEKVLINANNTAVTPFVENGVYYVPARFTAEGMYASVTVTESMVTVTRFAKEMEITKDIITKNGTVYVPAKAMADALGMELYTDARGLIAFLDGPTTYTEANKQAILKQLSTRVLIAGKDFVGFDVDKTHYQMRYDNRIPAVKLADGTAVTKNGNVYTFTLGGKTYTLEFIEDAFKEAAINFLLGNIPTASTAMGNSYVIERITDGNISSKTATIATTKLTEVTFTFDFGALYYIDRLELLDEQTSAGSTMDKATWYGKQSDGTWVELGVHEDLTAGSFNGTRRTNELTVADGTLYSALRVTMENTDNYTQRYFIYEIKAIGYQHMSDIYPYTETTYAVEDDNLVFTTDLIDVTPGGYIAVVLYKDDVPVGMKLQAYTDETSIESAFAKVDFDEARVMLVESFMNMRIMAEPETVEK